MKPSKPYDPKALSKAAAIFGAMGGRSGTGKAKARTRKQAQAAVAVRWENYRALKKKGTE